MSESLSISEANRIVGNDEKSSGFSINNVIENIRIASPKEADKPTSKTHDGTGKIITDEALTYPSLDIQNHGMGSIDLEVDADKIKTKLTGTGDVYLKGNAGTVQISHHGIGKIDALDLDALFDNYIKNTIALLANPEYKKESES